MCTGEPLIPESFLSRLKVLLKSWKDINRRILIKLRQNWLKQKVLHVALKSTVVWTLFGERNNYQSRGRNLLLYLYYDFLSDVHISWLNSYVGKISADHQCVFRCNSQLQIRQSAFVKYWRKMRQYITVFETFVSAHQIPRRDTSVSPSWKPRTKQYISY